MKSGEKRAIEDSSPAPEDMKKRKIEGDVTMATVCDVIETITEPDKMLGPEVRLGLMGTFTLLNCNFFNIKICIAGTIFMCFLNGNSAI